MKKQRDVKWLFCTALPKVMILLLTFPFMILIRIISPILFIRFIPISERIGHGIGNIDVYLLERTAGMHPSKVLDIFYPDRPWKINRQLVKMWKRLIPVYDFVYWIVWGNWGNPLFSPHYYASPNIDRDIHALSIDTPPPVSFTRNEEDRGAALLREMGIPPGSSIVCFHARDNAFLKEFKPTVNWEYHDFRNANIESYVPAIKELVARGYYTIRMGKTVNSAFPWKDAHVIDYAMSSWRSDFADIYLFSRCHFHIGSASGMDAVPGFFRKPQTVLNLIPIGNMQSWNPYINIFNKLWLIKEKRFLKFKEIIHSEVGLYQDAFQYKNYGLEIVNNTAEEILDVVIETEERLKGCWKTNDEYEELQGRLRALYKPFKVHQIFNARVGSKFLLQNKDLLD